MQRRFALALALAAVVTASAAAASEQSTRLYSQGLVQFHAGHLQEALSRFDEAVAADPSDMYARFYRGITRARLNNSSGAIADLRAVAESHAVKQAPLELGVVLVQAGQFEEAIPWLEEAQNVPTLDARASLFLGIAQLRVGRSVAARHNFDRAEEKDTTLRLPARYYRGIAAYQEGKFSDAERDFGYVAAYDPQSDMGRQATTFLQRIRSGEYSQWEAYGVFGMQYDSNVVLIPSAGGAADAAKDALQISNQADGRGVITVGGVYTPWQTEDAEVSVGYEFYQSLYFNLTEFNLQDHRPSVQGVMNLGIVQLGLLGRYDYYLINSEQSFLEETSALPWVAINEYDVARTEIFYRNRWREYKNKTYQTRDALNNEAGFRQLYTFGVPERYVAVGYRYDHESPTHASGDPFGYDGNEVDAGGGWSFPWGISAEFLYSYRHEDYAAQSDGRKDNENVVLVTFYKPINEYLAVTTGYLGDFNNSNQKPFEYTRNVGSVAFEVRFH
jgi:tetratricopeptide (TPR) repeat protein